VDIPQLLDAFAGGEHIEIVIARLPEWALAGKARDGDFERLYGAREGACLPTSGKTGQMWGTQSFDSW
jgi:hypothetical protein